MHGKEYLYTERRFRSIKIDVYSFFTLMKSRRQADHPRSSSIAKPLQSQERLRRLLHQRGFETTQATISRDIKELGLVKRSRRRRLPAARRRRRRARRPRSTSLERAAGVVPAQRGTRAAARRHPHRARAGAGARRSDRSRATARKRSARLPATTRFSSSPAAHAAPRRSSNDSRATHRHDTAHRSRIFGRRAQLGGRRLAGGARMGAEVVALTLDLGARRRPRMRRATARSRSAPSARTFSTSRDEFVRHYLVPALKADALYRGRPVARRRCSAGR